MGSVQVVAGVPTVVSLSAAAGMLVANTDSTDAVWIGPDSSVAPGNGTKLGPLGSVEWTTANSAVYAVVDTGVTNPVILTTSSDVSNVDNPVAVGSAVAAQLLATGVPSVLTGGIISYNDPSAIIDVSQYASITVSVLIVTPGKLVYQFFAGNGGVALSTRTLVIANPTTLTFSVPVNGPWFQISSSGGFSNLMMYGSNRALKETIFGTSASASKGMTQTWTASGTNTDLNHVFLTNGGAHELRLVVTGSGKGYVTVAVWEENAQAIVYIPIGHTGEGQAAPSGIAGVTELIKTVILPPGLLKFGFISYTAASFQVIVAVIPPN